MPKPFAPSFMDQQNLSDAYVEQDFKRRVEENIRRRQDRREMPELLTRQAE